MRWKYPGIMPLSTNQVLMTDLYPDIAGDTSIIKLSSLNLDFVIIVHHS